MLFKLRKCILTVKTQVFCKIFILVFLSLLLIILTRKYLKKHFKMGVQDVPEPFQNAVSFELVKQSAFMIDFRRILGAIWEGFGGQRLPPRTRLSVIKTIVGRLEASRSLKHHFGRFLEAKWYPFGSILDEFWVRVVRNLDAPGCITNPARCHTNNFRGYLSHQDCSSIILLKHHHKGYPPIRNSIHI